jgi:hypothetical protein
MHVSHYTDILWCTVNKTQYINLQREFWINAESYPVAQLCVNALLATKVTLNTD